ncbi:TetR/AcrR family transcriptional regulator [Leekyejoonella antrihumi]|uniref:TetR family transcriptional regulator n=1 Tax=Leekyejoonella antrihumi TaxID=1660198 RepID=A0A563E1T9_9MICO|nr:TetR/AcrR family transcriptional regulator [Leekyejoonella antrihumi]TWP36171.1 TetR family transcriptional regulator [Leekyejoonella antrihumi]
MARWAPDAADRLECAALDLFVENGFARTTVAQIADRAGVNRATFFRHFADKREVLFGGEDKLAHLFADGVRNASAGATLADCIRAAVLATGPAMTPRQRAKAVQRVQVLAANAEVQERGLLKHARIAAALVAALCERGFDELAARLAAEVGLLAFQVALERWIMADTADGSFSALAHTALNEVHERIPGLSAPTSASGRPE